MQAQWKALTEQTKYFANTAGKDTTRMGPSRLHSFFECQLESVLVRSKSDNEYEAMRVHHA